MKFTEELLEGFHNSLDRCQDNPKFLDIFYDRVVTSSPEITAFFDNVDLNRLKVMLRHSLLIVLMASEGSTHSQKRIKALSANHRNLGVCSEHYDIWLDVLMSVVEEVDYRYDIEVEKTWRAVMGVGIAIMKEPPEKHSAALGSKKL